MGLVTLAVASLAVAVVGTGASIVQGEKAQSAQKKARDVQTAQTQVNKQNAIRDQVRQQRVKAAQIQQASSNTGVVGSSGELGSTSSLGSQVGNNIGSLNEQGNTSTAISNNLQNAASASAKAATFGQVAQIGAQGFSIFSNTPEFKQKLNSVFGK